MGVRCTPYVRFSYDMPPAQTGKLMVEIRGTGPVSAALEKLERLGNDVLELRLGPQDGSDPGHFTDADFYLISRLEGLEILRLRHMTLPPLAIQQLAGLPKLSWIEMHCDGVTNDMLRQIALCRGLTGLEIGTRATAEGFAHLPDLKSLKQLTVWPAVTDDVAAELARCKVDRIAVDFGADVLGRGIAVGRRPQTFCTACRVYGAKISTAGLRHLQPRRLESLVLRSCPQVSDDLLDVIGGFSSLVSLCIWDIPLSDAGLKPLNQLGKLQGLNLRNNSHVTGAGFASLTALHKLRFLTIKGENVSDDLFAHLHQLKALEDLTVESGTKTVNAKITDEGIKSIQNMPKLMVITFEGTAITREGLEPLAAQPKLVQVNFSAAGVPWTRDAPSDSVAPETEAIDWTASRARRCG